MAKFSDAELQEALGSRLKVRRYGIPGFEGRFVGIKALTDAEMDSCRVRATDHVKKHKMALAVELAVDPGFFDRALQREIVAACCRDPDNEEEFFFSRGEDVAQLDNSTVLAFYQLFFLHQCAMDPYSAVSEEEVDALVEALGKSANAAESLSYFDLDSLRKSVLSLACRVRSLQATHSSATG